MTSNLRVLLVGDAMLDVYWDGATHRISPEAPVPVLSVSQIRYRPGGAANVAAGLAKLGSPVTLLAPLGEDECGERLADLLQPLNIAFERLTSGEHFVTTQKIRCMSLPAIAAR